MKKMKRFALAAFAAALAVSAVLVAGCAGNGGETKEAEGAAEKTEIVVGLRADGVDMFNAIKPKLEEAGYTVTTQVFDDSIQPNVALGEGAVDINWFQHVPYLNQYNESNGTDFVMVEPYTHYPLFAMYSTKIDKLDDLQDGAKIGLCNDDSNRARGLRLLEENGLIKIKEGVETPTVFDIEENPKNLEFIEAEMSVLPRSIDDVDAVILAAQHMFNAGKDATDFVVESSDGKDFPLGFVVRAEDADAQWAKDFATLAQCDELADCFATTYGGCLVPMWK